MTTDPIHHILGAPWPACALCGGRGVNPFRPTRYCDCADANLLAAYTSGMGSVVARTPAEVGGHPLLVSAFDLGREVAITGRAAGWSE